MKILVIGLDCAAPELLLGDERLANIRRLMEVGCYGRLESVIPPITVPAWMCMATSQDPGSLGVYGFRNRHRSLLRRPGDRQLPVDQRAGHLGPGRPRGEASRSSSASRRAIPPRKVNGISVGCFLTPDTAKDVYTHPPEVGDEIARLVGHYPVDVKGFRTDDKAWLRDEIYAMSRKHFEVVRHFLKNAEWDYFQFVEIGLDRIQHGFWKLPRPGARPARARTARIATSIRDYYRYLDDEIGSLLELLDRRHGRPGRLRPRRAAARRRLLRQRVAGPRGPARR